MKVDRLLKIAKQEAESINGAKIDEIFHRMTTEQLKELAEGSPTDDRVREILSSVGGLHLLESG